MPLIRVEPIADGFFVRPFPGLVQPLIDAHGFHHIALDLPVDSLQFFRCRTFASANGREHLVLTALDVPRELFAAIGRKLAVAFPHVSACLLLESRPGFARVELVSHGNAIGVRSVAASVAVWRCVGSWDESPSIRVIVDAATSSDVKLRFENGAWLADVD